MPAADRSRRAGFPTARGLVALALLVWAASPASAALLPPPVRLPVMFDREAWSQAAVEDRPLPVRPGVGPITFEERRRG